MTVTGTYTRHKSLLFGREKNADYRLMGGRTDRRTERTVGPTPFWAADPREPLPPQTDGNSPLCSKRQAEEEESYWIEYRDEEVEAAVKAEMMAEVQKCPNYKMWRDQNRWHPPLQL